MKADETGVMLRSVSRRGADSHSNSVNLSIFPAQRIVFYGWLMLKVRYFMRANIYSSLDAVQLENF